jgi:hypothetical protein
MNYSYWQKWNGFSLDLIKGKTEPSNFLEAPEKWLK